MGIHERARASWVYDLYWNFADKQILDDRRREVSFYRNVLAGFRPGDLIFDVGANVGYKADIFMRLGAGVVAVEPDELNQGILKQRFLQYRLRKRPLTVVGKAVSDTHSIQRMWIDVPGSAKNTLSQKWADTLRDDESRFGERLTFGQWKEIETISLDQLIASYGTPFFIKIDVEGYELNVLRGLRRPVPYLSFEVNLPEFRSEGMECLEVLERLAEHGTFNYTPDCCKGLSENRWLSKREMSAALESCQCESVEVFWRTQTGAEPRQS